MQNAFNLKLLAMNTMFQITIIIRHTRSFPRDFLISVDLHLILMINISSRLDITPQKKVVSDDDDELIETNISRTLRENLNRS